MPSASAEFIDTNILVYEWDDADPKKRNKARSLVKRLGERGVISSQVAQEFAWSARRKLSLTDDEIGRILGSYQVFRFVPIEMGLVWRALSTSTANTISFWDALVVEAAVEAGCKVLHTEDLKHGQEIRGVRIANPFAG